MAEFKFACPHCGQNIRCEEQWSGQQIACPACSGSLVVPLLRPVVVAVTASSAPPPAAVPIPRAAAPPAPAAPKSSGKILVWSLGGAAFVVAMFFVLKLTSNWQNWFNRKSDDMAAHSSGGEMAHIANVYKVLDATDPDKMAAGQIKMRAAIADAEAKAREAAKLQPDPTLSMPLLPPTWTLDVVAATIPKGRVNGSSSGTAFHVETVSLDRGPSSAVLTFQEGVGTTADHELTIYLPVGTNDDLAGKSWSVAKEAKGKAALQIVKRWTMDPKFAPVQKTIYNGYAMKLELGEPTRDWQPGRIFLALPDTNQTVMAGEFSISIPRKLPWEVSHK